MVAQQYQNAPARFFRLRPQIQPAAQQGQTRRPFIYGVADHDQQGLIPHPFATRIHNLRFLQQMQRIQIVSVYIADRRNLTVFFQLLRSNLDKAWAESNRRFIALHVFGNGGNSRSGESSRARQRFSRRRAHSSAPRKA